MTVQVHTGLPEDATVIHAGKYDVENGYGRTACGLRFAIRHKDHPSEWETRRKVMSFHLMNQVPSDEEVTCMFCVIDLDGLP